MKIVVFTGGGHTQALNSTLYGVITECKKHKFTILGGLFGWKSVIEGNFIDLTDIDVSSIKNVGGTFLKTSRTNPLKIDNGVEKIKENLIKENIDGIIAIGGDDTLGAANKLAALGIPVVGIPKTIDNDLSATYFTPGFASAAYYLGELVHTIRRDSGVSRNRVYVIEALGGNAGWLTASTALAKADVIIPCEKEYELNTILKKVKEKIFVNKGFAVVTVSKEAKINGVTGVEEIQDDTFGVKRNKHISIALADEIKKSLGVQTQAILPGNFMSSGRPSDVDRDLSIKLGGLAVNLVMGKKFGHMSIISRDGDCLSVKNIPIKQAVGEYKSLTEKYFDFDNFCAKEEFFDYMLPIVTNLSCDKEYYELIDKIHGL